MALLSKNIVLSYKAGDTAFVPLTNLMEIPELGGDVDKIEITTLDSEAHEYMNGLLNYGDTIPFKFLYENEQFMTLSGLQTADEAIDWQVTLPDGVLCAFSGTPSVKLDAVGNNSPITYTLNIAPSSKMEIS